MASIVFLKKFIEHLPSGEPHFPADQYTDQPERFLAAELIREKAMAGTFTKFPMPSRSLSMRLRKQTN